MQVGLIGAGMMGRGMAANLLKHGHGVTVLAHRGRSGVDRLVAAGASEAKDLADIAAADAILLCLTTSAVVEGVVGGLEPHLRPGQVVMDAGTTAPDLTRKMARALDARGVGFADIPLTGGPEQAEQGVLGVLCGADDATFERIVPLLSCFATTIKRFGPPGSGQTAKLISNFIVTGTIALVAEAFGAARKAGIGWADLYAAMLNGSGKSVELCKVVEPSCQVAFDGYFFAMSKAA